MFYCVATFSPKWYAKKNQLIFQLVIGFEKSTDFFFEEEGQFLLDIRVVIILLDDVLNFEMNQLQFNSGSKDYCKVHDLR